MREGTVVVRRLVTEGEPLDVLVQILNAPVLDTDALGRVLLRLRAMDQVVLGGTLMRIAGGAQSPTSLARLGEALACRGARRLSQPLDTTRPEEDPT